ncbi:hypothetical protein HLH17_14390 [Acinetobacter sp. ANC 5380]|uniref:Uncharacterized protein n=1 Tax=Acinetobacter terrae TaxID=2731247 RepID=A0A7Y2RHD5_9GAMM|nr:hypothetical protein [Acinetobacter terrae]NNH78810.1 hypothetical protein [Acinetobacter terrae]
MGNLLKRLGSTFLEDGLAISGVLLAAISFLSFLLFGMADFVVSQAMPFDDLSKGGNSLLFTYFLDFSGVFSSILVVTGLVGFIFSQMLLMNIYLQTKQAKWLLVIGLMVMMFYGLISFLIPKIENLENKYTGNSLVAPHVLRHDYNTAYGVVGSEDLSEMDQAYLNAQISAYQYISSPNDENQEILNADSMGLEIALIDAPDSAKTLSSDVVAKIYNLSTIKNELPVMEVISDDVKKKEWGISALIALLYAVVIFKIIKYRREVGM